MRQLILLLFTGMIFAHQVTAQVKPFGILQGLVSKYNTDKDVTFGGSLSGGLLFMKFLGVGLNVQAYKQGPGDKYYLPVSFELSFFTEKLYSPYFNIQAGKGIYRITDRFGSPTPNYLNRTTGGLYLSPGAGMLIPFFGKSKVLVTGSFTRSEYKREVSWGNDAGFAHALIIRSGYKIGLGFKL